MAINVNNLQNKDAQSILNKSSQRQVQEESTLKANVQQQQLNPTTTKDSVSLTPQAQQFNKLQQKASNTPDVDQNKVAQIKKAIAEGKYEINVDRLADKLSNFESDLFK